MQQLPPGQYELHDFPRFGLQRFADRLPRQTAGAQLQIAGDVRQPLQLVAELNELARVEQTSDFHCVTTWSRRALHWSGFRFRDLYERIVMPRSGPAQGATLVVLRCQDGYATSLPLADLLADDVLLADRLNGQLLPIAHGAPLRLVAPAHYGYKNAKHLHAIEFRRDDRQRRSAIFPFAWMDHPRARVALEERGRGLPGPLLRYLYRPLVRPTIRLFDRALERHLAETGRD